MDEVWKHVPGYHEVEISTHGKLRNSKSKCMYSDKPNSYGYILNNVNRKLVRRHKLMEISFPCHFLGQIGDQIDHINNERSDNNLSNLRKCTRQQNMHNSKSYCGSSKYKGVYKIPGRKKMWRARIKYNGTHISCGQFYTELEAAKAYDAKAIELHGEFVKLNIGGISSGS